MLIKEMFSGKRQQLIQINHNFKFKLTDLKKKIAAHLLLKTAVVFKTKTLGKKVNKKLRSGRYKC